MSRQDQQELVVLGRAIGQIRRELGVSAEELADAADIERTSLSALEAGQLNPTYELLLILAEGLGIRPSAFVIRAEQLAAQGPGSGCRTAND
ncbi:MAG TPA: helix-turn-helix transcriptional regulator [Solirubrobacteraceae bacterium]|nr:helix-turn-helix transcriptional regulator [Solirubrobacteraceae bacterium]